VVLDINLPGMSGIEGIRHIREMLRKAEIMMMSVMDDSQSVFNSLCAGAAGYVDKETPLEKIKEYIVSLSQGGSPITPAIARKVVEFFKPDKKFKEDLTPREKDIIQGIVDGLSYKLIADRLGISHDTVRKHILSTYRKLQINSKGELLARYHQGNI
jgi:DNA-binding NarL/FixJ family response regulator